MSANAIELELVERAGRGEEAATAELVNRVLPTVRGLARRLAGNDEEGDALAHDAILAAIENIQKYRGDATFSTWVCGIAVKRFASMQRASTTERRIMERLHRQVPPKDPEQIAVARVTARDLWLLVAELPAGYREAIIARTTSDTSERAGEKIGLTANTFRVRLHRARLALAKSLRKRFPELVEDYKYARE